MNLTKALNTVIDLPRDILHFAFYLLFLFSLYCITKPLAYIVDVLSTDDDIKFLEDQKGTP